MIYFCKRFKTKTCKSALILENSLTIFCEVITLLKGDGPLGVQKESDM